MWKQPQHQSERNGQAVFRAKLRNYCSDSPGIIDATQQKILYLLTVKFPTFAV